MKAIVCRRYGSPEAFRLEDVEKPEPQESEVLIHVRAAALNALDWHMLKGRPAFARLFLGLRSPKAKRTGRDVAGRVEAVGSGVTRFKPGDDVFGFCRGSLAEYACAPEAYLAAKPANVSFEDAAATPLAGLTALQALRDKAKVQPGQRVLVNGAAGGVGTFAVQIARSQGAEVTGVCGTASVDMVRSIGAEHVVDYAREDFTRGARPYDVIFDLVANHSFAACRGVLTAQGIYMPAGFGGSDGREFGRRLGRALAGALASRFVKQQLVFATTRIRQADVVVLGELLASRTVRPVIDSRHRLNETPEAFRRLATGHAHGKVVIIVGEQE